MVNLKTLLGIRRIQERKMPKCYYCPRNSTKVAVCNDWGNIPLCDAHECYVKFRKEYTGQFIWKDVRNKTRQELKKEFPELEW